MNDLVSSDKTMTGIFRATVLEAITEMVDGVETKSARIYIPALHKTEMPFSLASNGEVQGLSVSSASQAGLTTINLTPSSGTNTTSNTATNGMGLNMKLEDYPVAQICSWSVCPEVEVGESVWCMFENADSQYPVILGDLAGILPLASAVLVSGSGGSGGSGGSSGSSGGVYVGDSTTGNANADYVFYQCIAAGMTIAGACGVLANLEAENNFSTSLNSGDGGLASGICQWHPDRWANCESYCASIGKDPTTIEGQTAFLIHELQSYPDLWNLLCSAPQTGQGAYDAAYKFCVDFERPSDKYSKGNDRGNIAKDKYFPIFGSGRIENGSYVTNTNTNADTSAAISVAELTIVQQLTSMPSFDVSNRTDTDIDHIVIHYTGNAGSTAKNNADAFMHLNNKTSAHYFVDENSTVYQSVLDKDIAWHAGNYPMNKRSIGIEMCCDIDETGNWYIEPQTITNTIALTKALMAKYNVPVSNVIRHYDVTGKECPEPFVRNPSQWDSFKARLS